MEIFTKSAKETFDFGKNFANRLRGGEVLALVGDLGSGKTTFVQGLAEGLGIKDKIISPTFILMRQYEVKSAKGEVRSLHHLDLYRLENPKHELKSTGVEDLWGKPNNIVVIEWAEKAKDLIPKNATWINFEHDEERRRVLVK